MSSYSAYVLCNSPANPGGWFSDAALAAMPNFEETYICDPSDPQYGYI